MLIFSLQLRQWLPICLWNHRSWEQSLQKACLYLGTEYRRVPWILSGITWWVNECKPENNPPRCKAHGCNTGSQYLIELLPVAVFKVLTSLSPNYSSPCNAQRMCADNVSSAQDLWSWRGESPSWSVPRSLPTDHTLAEVSLWLCLADIAPPCPYRSGHLSGSTSVPWLLLYQPRSFTLRRDSWMLNLAFIAVMTHVHLVSHYSPDP